MTCPNCGSEQLATASFCAACGQPLGGMHLAGGTVLDRRYQVVTVLASGSSGAVYQALDLRLGRHPVAIKELRTDRLDGRDREEAFAGLEREAERLAGLRHPGLPVIHDLFEYAGNGFVVMDLVEGSDLAELLRLQTREGEGGFGLSQVSGWGRQMAGILECLHGQDPPLAHGALLPSHVMRRGRDGVLLLVDLNLGSHFLPRGRPLPAAIRRYLPPEHQEKLARPLSDLYSLGALLLQLATGKSPSSAWIRRRIEEFPPGWQAFFTRALQPRAQDRFASAREMGAALAALEVPATPAPPRRAGPGVAARLCAEALESLKHHRVGEAILRCNQAIMLDPECRDAYLYLGHAYLKDDRPVPALENYRKAVSLSPHDSLVFCNLALGLSRLGAWDEAEAALKKALELDPGNLVARNNLGSLYRERGRREEALETYRQVLDQDPDYMAAHYNLGLTYYEMGRFKEAVKENKEALRLDQQNVNAWINLGLAHYQMGKFKLCVEAHRKALELEPGNPVVYNNLGVAQNALGRREEALAAFQQAIFLDRQMALSRYNLQIMAQKAGE